MMKTRVKILVVGLTVLGISAGVVTGMLVSRLPAVSSAAHPLPPMPPGGVPAPLVEELQLTPDQQDKMRAIWEGTRDQVHDCFDEAERLQKERDEAIAAIMTPEQKAQFEKIAKTYADRYSGLERKREETFEKAVQETRKLLTEEQRKKYDAILAKRVGPRPPGGHGSSPPPPSTLQ